MLYIYLGLFIFLFVLIALFWKAIGAYPFRKKSKETQAEIVRVPLSTEIFYFVNNDDDPTVGLITPFPRRKAAFKEIIPSVTRLFLKGDLGDLIWTTYSESSDRVELTTLEAVTPEQREHFNDIMEAAMVSLSSTSVVGGFDPVPILYFEVRDVQSYNSHKLD